MVGPWESKHQLSAHRRRHHDLKGSCHQDCRGKSGNIGEGVVHSKQEVKPSTQCRLDACSRMSSHTVVDTARTSPPAARPAAT